MAYGHNVVRLEGQRFGARIGDHIILTLDLERRTAVVSWEQRGTEGSGP